MNMKHCYEEDKEKKYLIEVLEGSLMYEINYCETFALAFELKVDKNWIVPRFSLTIDAQCWFRDMDEWENKIKSYHSEGAEDICLGAELIGLRYKGATFVKKVEYFEGYFSIMFSSGDKLFISNDSDSDFSWSLDEIQSDIEKPQTSIYCCDRKLYSNNFQKFIERYN